MSENMLSTQQGTAFFVDLEKLIEEEKKIENKRSLEKKRNTSTTALFIPFYKKTISLSSLAGVHANQDLSHTFTKEDFYNLKNDDNTISDTIVGEVTAAKLFHIPSPPQNDPTNGLKRIKSSPNITYKKTSMTCTTPKSYTEETENHNFELCNTTSKSRLPKLPNWVLQKHHSLDSNISPFDHPEQASPIPVKKLSLTKQTESTKVKIEEMFLQCQQQRDYSASANVLPPINSSPVKTQSPPTGSRQDVTSKKSSTVSKIKGKRDTKNKKTTKKIIPKKKKKNTKSVYQHTTHETIRDKKLSKTKNKSKSNALNEVKIIDSKKLEETPNKHFSLSTENKSYKEQNNCTGVILTKQSDEGDTLDDFYNTVLSANPTQKNNNVNRKLFVSDLSLDLLNTKSTLNRMDSLDAIPPVNTYDLVESMERTLSLDASPVSEPFFIDKSIPRSQFLSRISEEKSNLSTLKSVPKHQCSKSGRSTLASKSDSNTFKEMSNVLFQPGLVPGVSLSTLKSSVSLNHTFSLTNSNSSSTDRPYLRSVIGNSSPRSFYSSSPCPSQNSEVNVLEWQKGKVIDKGAFGVVYQGLTTTAQLIAVKEVNIGQSKNTTRNFRKLQDEVNILKALKHPNIIKFIGTSLEDGTVYIFMEYIAGGSLAGLIASFGPLNESIYQRYTKQILSAVAYVHDCGVVHRDIKGANILITVKGTIKLIDFGCAKELSLSVGSVMLLKSVKGTPYWMAPEVIQGTGCNHKSDIWSIGCTVMEMATGKPPWSDHEPYAAMYAVADESKETPTLDNNEHSQHAVRFVQLCMTRNMNLRPSAFDLLNHPFVSAHVT